MPEQGLNTSVRTFVRQHVRTLDELELLMGIIQSGDRWWDAAAAAREFGIAASTAAAAFDYFAAHNLLDIRITGDVRYQFHPGTPELRDAAHATLDVFRTRPLDLAKLLRKPSIGDFADAFRLRRKK